MIGTRRRSMLMGGLRIVLRHPGAVVWTYVLNLGIAVLFSLRLHAQLASLLNHSMVAQGLNAGFDLGVAAAALQRLGEHTPSGGATMYAGLPVYFLVYFVLVPGALFSYRIAAPGRLAILMSSGLCFFWRFVRIALLTVLVSALVLGPLLAVNSAWGAWVVEHEVGGAQLWWRLPVWIAIALVAALVRLYFDLVEVYTVQLDDRYLANGRPDRRVRRTLIPAVKTLWSNLPRALGMFVVTALVGVLAVVLTGRIAVHMLAQPRVWPAFLLIQVGMLVSLLTRYWQRGAETVLVADYPLPGEIPGFRGAEDLQVGCGSNLYDKVHQFPVEVSPGVLGTAADPLDAVPNPEPAPPSEAIAPGVPKKHDSGIFRVYPPSSS
jgi:hypothetical protein